MSRENQPTLQDLRKRKFSTIKAFAEALGVSPSTAGAWLRGDYSWRAPSYGMQWKMRELLGVSAPEFYTAMNETEKEERKKRRTQR